jgi:hypothetical protein
MRLDGMRLGPGHLARNGEREKVRRFEHVEG